MIGSRRNLRVLAYPAPADLRKGYNRLSGLVLQDLGKDPLSGESPYVPTLLGAGCPTGHRARRV